MASPEPFALPTSVPVRRHGPSGYANYQEYKDWLRDEFIFRCAYCLERERWYPSGWRAFAIDHIQPQTRRPDLICDYENLVYACLRCNSYKQDQETLDVTRVALGEHVRFEQDGSVVGLTDEGKAFLRLFHLDSPALTAVRRGKMRILQLKRDFPQHLEVDALFHDAFGFPDELPDLAAQRPKSNSRPQGIPTSHFARRQTQTLEEVY